MRRGYGRHAWRFGSAWSPSYLFADGSQGAWYDNSNMSTMFQDSAGTTPAVLESPVGKQLDLSGRGNHRSQATSANRPLLSARYNLLTKTEDFSNAAWAKIIAGTGTTPVVTVNYAMAPNGTQTANRVTFNRGVSNTGGDYSLLSQSVSYSSTTFVKRLWLMSNTGASQNVLVYDNSSQNGQVFVATPIWQAFTIGAGIATAGAQINIGVRGGTGGYSNGGDQTLDILVWGADLRPTDQTVTLPAYQRVDTSTVYDTAGFPQYIKYNGSSQFLSTASVDFTATAQMSVFAGVRKLASGVAVFVELSGGVDANNNAFNIASDAVSANNWYFSAGATTQGQISVQATPYAAPITSTLSVMYNRSVTGSSQITPKVNSITPSLSYSGTGSTGNFGNYPLYFGNRNGATLPFNSQEYQMIIVGKTLTTAQITSTETFVNGKTKAYA